MHYTLKGKRRAKNCLTEAKNSSLSGSRAKLGGTPLDFILLYLKHNRAANRPNQAYHGCMFEISQAKVSDRIAERWVCFLCPVLETALTKLGHMPQTGSSYQHFRQTDKGILADVTERPVPRRSGYQAQKEEYSHRGSGGEKKSHTVKNLAITGLQGCCLFLSDTYEGAMHDKTLWDELHVDLKGCPVLADLGFIGTDKGCFSIQKLIKK